MKIMKVLLFLLIALFCFVGCGTIATVPYSFTENDNGIAEITFQTNLNRYGFSKGRQSSPFREGRKKSILLMSVNENELPLPEMRTVWNPVSFPAGEPITLNLNIFHYYDPEDSKKGGLHSSGSVLVDIIVVPAEAIAGAIVDTVAAISAEGWRNMDVTFNCPPLEAGGSYKLEYIERWLQKPKLVLTDISTKKIVYEQLVAVNWRAGGKGNWQWIGRRQNVLPKQRPGE